MAILEFVVAVSISALTKQILSLLHLASAPTVQKRISAKWPLSGTSSSKRCLMILRRHTCRLLGVIMRQREESLNWLIMRIARLG